MKLLAAVGFVLICGVLADKLDSRGRTGDQVCATMQRPCGNGLRCEPYPSCRGQGCDQIEWAWLAACRPDHTDPAVCTFPLVGGNCRAYFPNYGYNTQTGLCERFIYGGCGGNGNRFQTKRSCEAHCVRRA